MPTLTARAAEFGRRHARAAFGFLLLFTFFRMALLEGWDDAFYLAQLTSVVGDRDLMLQDDLLALANPFPMRFRALTIILGDGSLQNTFSVGPALLHASYTWPALVGRVWPDLGLLRVLLALGSMAALIAFVVVTASLAARLGTPRPLSDVAAVLSVAAGPLALYGTRSYLGSHLLSALWCAVLLRVLLAWLEFPRPRFGAALGLAAGLLVVTRWQDGVLVAAFGPAFLASVLSDREGRRARLVSLALAAAAGTAVVAVQALAWHAQYGSWFVMPQGGAYVSWSRPRLGPLLLSTYHGLLPWAPGLALGLLGVAFVRPPVRPAVRRALVAGLIAAAAATIYVSSSVWDWWGGDAYGPRRLAVLTPIAACGLGALLARLPRPGRWALVMAIGIWSAVTVTAFVSGYDDLRVAWGHSPDEVNPVGPAAYDTARWIDRPGTWPRMLRPGFTFSDRPDNRDRLVGAAAALAVFVLSLFVLDRLRRSARVQRAVVAVGLVWVLVSLAWMAALPSNGTWNRTWSAVVAGADPAPLVGSLPEGVATAAWAVAAVHASERGDAAAVERARKHLPAAVTLNEADVAAALDGEGRRFVRDLRAGRRIVLP
jgi:hypothetical protein